MINIPVKVPKRREKGEENDGMHRFLREDRNTTTFRAEGKCELTPSLISWGEEQRGKTIIISTSLHLERLGGSLKKCAILRSIGEYFKRA